MSNIYEHLLYSNITAINEDYYNESITRMEKFYENNINSLITFIIPSINRESLENTIRSLEEQKYEKWCGIIIFDNCYPSENIKKKLDNDLRFLYISIKKRGGMFIENDKIRSFSGDVRNIGMSLIKTDWIAFIDDDDTISKDYLTIFTQEIKTDKLIDCIIFRMVSDNKIIPSNNLPVLIKGHIGISFIYRTSLYKEGFIFYSCDIEDYVLLKELEDNNKKIIILPYIKYFIKNIKHNNNFLYTNEKKLKKVVIKKEKKIIYSKK